MNKTCTKEKKRPKKKQEYKPKPKQPKMEYPEPQILYEDGIPYIMLGNTPYALDENMKNIDYALTKVLRETLYKKV